MALNGKRVISSIGDGSFQVTAQDISTMMREGEAEYVKSLAPVSELLCGGLWCL
jgi:TPP-dependent 2-oxoacid decarboxylase